MKVNAKYTCCLLMLFLAASILSCTREKETITPELVAFNLTPTPFSVALKATVHNAKHITDATFVVWFSGHHPFR